LGKQGWRKRETQRGAENTEDGFCFHLLRDWLDGFLAVSPSRRQTPARDARRACLGLEFGGHAAKFLTKAGFLGMDNWPKYMEICTILLRPLI
jgi:hypothetical protein